MKRAKQSKVCTIANSLVKQGYTRAAAMVKAWILVKLPQVVMKNNAAECVLMSPEEYLRLMGEVNDARLLAVANERMANHTHADAIPAEEVYRELGITEEDIASCDEVEIE